MKLVEILARELEEWPEPNGHAWQDYSKEIRFNRTIESDFYVEQMCDDHIREINHPNPKTGVTREMWEAERARIKGEKAMPKANKEGWIRHRGKMQPPVEPGTIIDVRYRNGDIDEASEVGEDEEWLHEGSPYDVMAWRPHKPDNGVIAFHGSELIPVLDNPADPNEALKDVLELDLPTSKTDGPIQWRDRIREIDAAAKEEEARHCAAMEAYDAERSSLIAKLKAEGFVLIQSDEPNSMEESAQQDIAQQDMSDPANWRVGDLVKSVNDEADDILIGGVYALWKEPDIDGGYLYLVDSDGDKRNRCIEDYAFHSRPAQ